MLYIKKDLYREVSYAEQAQAFGKINNRTKGSTTKNVIEDKLRFIKKELNIDEKLDYILEVWNRGSKKQMLLLDTWPSYNKGTKINTIKNISLLSRLDDKDSEKFNSNTLIINCQGEAIVMGGKLQLKLTLTRVEFLDANDSSFEIESDYFKSIDSLPNIMWDDEKTNTFTTPSLDDKLIFHFLGDLKKYGRIDDRVRIRDWFSFLQNFVRFLNNKIREKETAFLYDINTTFGEEVVFEKSKEISFHVGIKREENSKFIEVDQKINLTNSKDADISVSGIITKSELVDLKLDLEEKMNLLEDENDKYADELEKNESLLKETENRKTEIEKEIEKTIELLGEKRSEKRDISDKIKTFEEEKNSIQDDIAKMNGNIKNLSKKPKLKKGQKSSERSIKTRENKIIKINKEIETKNIEFNDVTNSINVCKKELEIIDNHISDLKIDRQSLNIEIQKINIILNKEEINQKDLQKKISSIKNEAKKIEKFMDTPRFSEFSLYKVWMKVFKKDNNKNVDLIFKKTDIYSNSWNDFYDSDWEVSMFNFGTLTKVKRYFNAIDNFKSGFYKNPYQLMALFRPSLISQKMYLDAANDIKNTNKEKLNDYQIKAAAKAIATRDISYIQGPPGTGKTQTISALAEYGISKGETILVTSSTHAAIDNFYERIDESYKNNPNIFLLRYIYRVKDTRKNNYLETDLFTRFLESVDISFNENIMKQSNDDFNFKAIKDRLTEMIQANVNGNLLIPKEEIDFLSIGELFAYSDFEIINSWKAFFKKNNFLELSNIKNYFEEIEEKSGAIIQFKDKETFKSIVEKLVVDINEVIAKLSNVINEIMESDLFNEYNEILDVLYSKSLIDSQIISIENIINVIDDKLNSETNNESEFEKIYKSVVLETSDAYEDEKTIINISMIGEKAKTKKQQAQQFFVTEELKFLKTLYKEKLLNVIGITTTSRKTIEFIGESIDLFVDYSIDRVIIDEVSKSNTPEILSNINLASRVTLAGDYRQLNPIFDIEQELIEEFVESEYYDKMREYISFDENGENGEHNPVEGLTKYLTKLYEESLFANQISEINKTQKNERLNSYQYLTKQYRFAPEIMNVVNEISYKGNEELTLGRKLSDFKTYELEIDKNTINGSLGLIDTSYLSNEYLTWLNSERKSDKETLATIAIGDNSFDQDTSIRWYNGRKEKSKINDYNAFVILRAVEDMVINKKVEPSKIGIISMTNSQSKNIMKFLKSSNYANYFEGIRVDTVDNFQGSESEIIIVDLVRAPGSYHIKDDRRGFLTYPAKRNLEFYKKPQRLNVALSRAKSKLIIVGAIEGHLKEIESIINIDGFDEKIQMFNTIDKQIKEEDKITWKSISTSNENFII